MSVFKFLCQGLTLKLLSVYFGFWMGCLVNSGMGYLAVFLSGLFRIFCLHLMFPMMKVFLN